MGRRRQVKRGGPPLPPRGPGPARHLQGQPARRRRPSPGGSPCADTQAKWSPAKRSTVRQDRRPLRLATRLLRAPDARRPRPSRPSTLAGSTPAPRRRAGARLGGRCAPGLARALIDAVQLGNTNAAPLGRGNASTASHRADKERYWKPREVEAFLASCKTHRHFPLWCPYLRTGARRSETLALRWTDLDLINAEVTFTRDIKSEAVIRTNPLDDQTIDVPKAWRKGSRLSAWPPAPSTQASCGCRRVRASRRSPPSRVTVHTGRRAFSAPRPR